MLKVFSENKVEEHDTDVVKVSGHGIEFYDKKMGFTKFLHFSDIERFELEVKVTPKMKETSEKYQRTFTDKNPKVNKTQTLG